MHLCRFPKDIGDLKSHLRLCYGKPLSEMAMVIYLCVYYFLFIDDRRDVSRYGEDNRGYGGSQGGGRGRGGYDKDGRGPMTGSISLSCSIKNKTETPGPEA